MPTHDTIATPETIGHYFGQKGIKQTQQRKTIVEEFLNFKGHMTIDDLLLRVRQIHPNVGYATVYRTLKLLKDAGFAEERHFSDGKATYEPTHEDHHDHLICTQCKKIVEFEDHDIEALQEKVAHTQGFIITGHKMELYGICPDCQNQSPGT